MEYLYIVKLKCIDELTRHIAYAGSVVAADDDDTELSHCKILKKSCIIFKARDLTPLIQRQANIYSLCPISNHHISQSSRLLF